MVGMTAAIIGSAAISAGAGLLSSSSQKKAAKQAASIQANSSREQNALTRDIYDRNYALLAPWNHGGMAANDMIMSALGMPSAPAASAFGPPPSPGSSPYPYAFGSGYSVGGNAVPGVREMVNGDVVQPSAFDGAPQSPMQFGQPAPAAPPNPRSAFDTFRGSTGYDFRFGEGMRALDSAFSRNRESGAFAKAAMRYGQGIASDEFGRWIDLLRGQQQIGLTGASALAGVGTNFGNTINASNQTAADAAANARLYSGHSNAAMWQNLGSSFATALGALGGGGMPGYARRPNPFVLGM